MEGRSDWGWVQVNVMPTLTDKARLVQRNTRTKERGDSGLPRPFSGKTVFRIRIYYYADPDPGPYFSLEGSGSERGRARGTHKRLVTFKNNSSVKVLLKLKCFGGIILSLLDNGLENFERNLSRIKKKNNTGKFFFNNQSSRGFVNNFHLSLARLREYRYNLLLLSQVDGAGGQCGPATPFPTLRALAASSPAAAS